MVSSAGQCQVKPLLDKDIIKLSNSGRSHQKPLCPHLWAFSSAALGPLAEHLTPGAGAELAARAVPHVSMVTHHALVLAAPLGSGTFITAPTGPLHFGLTLHGDTVQGV